MQLSISGHHIDITNALHDYVTGKFDRLVRHSDHITNVHVVLSVEKLAQKAEATVHISGAELFADATMDDMYAAIDTLADKLDRQLLRHKEKTVERHHARG
jgi:putative sigma-54 modulation protein